MNPRFSVEQSIIQIRWFNNVTTHAQQVIELITRNKIHITP